MKKVGCKYICLAVLCAVCVCCGGNTRRLDAGGSETKAAIDSLNRRAFEIRYKDIGLSKEAAARALRLIEHAAPDYNDARAEALNHLAYANFLTSRFDSTLLYIDGVRAIGADYPNRAVEEAITRITEARLLLRQCLYAEAFTIYDSTITIFRGPLRRLRYGGSERYDWARSDYLIGNAVLDYYYRETELPVILRSLDEVERRENLHVDTTQMSILYYTYAGSFERAIPENANNVLSALDNVERGLDLLADPASRNDYQLANIYQIVGNILMSPGTAKWLSGPDSVEIKRRFDRLEREYFVEKYGWSEAEIDPRELPLRLLLKADSLFRPYDDPYQGLASNLYIGDYHLERGDTARARDYFNSGIVFDSLMSARGGSAPRWTSRLYSTLIANASDDTPVERIQEWYAIYGRNKEVIDRNERRDYNTQKERDEAKSYARRAQAFAALALAVCAVVTVLLYYLWKRNRQLRFMQKKLIEQKRMELLTHVVRGVSHELSQPLGSITQTLYDTFGDVATLGEGREKLSDESYSRIVGNIETDLRTIARGKDAISDLVSSFRNTIRENVVDPEAEFDLAGKLDDIVKIVRPGLKSNIALEVDCPPGLVVRSFPLLFGQVVTNLISNAGQHAFPDSDSPDDRIRIVCRDVAGDLVVKCADNGTGIPEEELERLCQPFVSKKRTNLGLGLSLVKNIVEQHMNGSIAFSSEGGGLTVTVTIPHCIVKV